jgi:serine/threonine protein kinase
MFLKKKKKLSETESLTYIKQILNGFKGLHEANTMHRDFKLANVLLHNNVCKIADLGFAKQLKDRSLTGTVLGTDETMAP